MVEVLRHAAATTGAEKSATQTFADQWSDAHCIRHLWAEYSTIAAANHERYEGLVRSCLTQAPDVSREEVDAVEMSPVYGPLLAAVQDAESEGLDVDQALLRLVAGRRLAGADDVAAVLHRRITRWATDSRPTDVPIRPRIVGLFPAATTNDPEVNQALDDRRALIEQSARALTLTAIDQRQPWISALGRPPAEPARRDLWRCQADLIAAYRDHWQITRASWSDAEPRSLEQEREVACATAAVNAAQESNQAGCASRTASLSEPSPRRATSRAGL